MIAHIYSYIHDNCRYSDTYILKHVYNKFHNRLKFWLWILDVVSIDALFLSNLNPLYNLIHQWMHILISQLMCTWICNNTLILWSFENTKTRTLWVHLDAVFFGGFIYSGAPVSWITFTQVHRLHGSHLLSCTGYMAHIYLGASVTWLTIRWSICMKAMFWENMQELTT